MDKAIEVAGLPRRKCVTKKFHIHGYRKNPNLADHMYVYGSDEPKILNLIKENPALGEKLSPKFGYTLAEVVWAVREEMALTVEDVLARRVRLLFVDAREAMAAAPKVAETMARELGRDQTWIDAQVESFTKMAKDNQSCLCMEVSDTGIGMSEEHIHHVFVRAGDYVLYDSESNADAFCCLEEALEKAVQECMELLY